MKRFTFTHSTFVLLLLFLVLLSGCAHSVSNIGRVAQEKDNLPLISGTNGWQTSDIKIDYNVAKSNNTYSLKGILYIQDRIYYNFSQYDFFNLYINYLDENNRVIASHEISPSIRFQLHYKRSFTLRPIPDAPPEAVAFAFSYWGNFYSNDHEHESTGDWEIYHNPFFNQG